MIVVVGDIVTDIVAVHSGALAAGSDTDARITVTGGGSAANTAAWLVTAGATPVLVGRVGDDGRGRSAVEELSAASEAVRTSLIKIVRDFIRTGKRRGAKVIS